jgi:DeoR/GlpR family transcriptional regulator of sugar metabolism
VSVLAEERKQTIINLLNSEGKVRVVPLAEQFNVSPETIRRDLDVLEKDGLLRRVYGGATKPLFQTSEAPFTQRQFKLVKEKEAIGRCAAALIEDGDTIAIDVGTTALELVKAITGRRRLTVLTNSVSVAIGLMDGVNQGRFSGKIILLGGELNPEQQSISGSICERTMQQFRVSKAFLSSGGVSMPGGISDYDPDEASMSRIFAQTAERVFVLADHSKLGVISFTHMLSFEEVDSVISDSPCPEGWAEHLAENEVEWIEAAVID